MKQPYILKNNVVKFRRLTLILLTLLVGGNMAWAWAPTAPGTYRLRSSGTSGNNFDVYDEDGTTLLKSNQTAITNLTITEGTYRLIFENTRTINMTGQIYINANDGKQAHLIMELGTPPEGDVANTAANPTLRIDNIPNTNNQAVAFFINKKSIYNHTQHTITIKGKAPSAETNEDIDNFVYDFSNNFVIDGSGPTLELVDGDTWEPKVKATGGKVVGSGMFRIQEGSLTLQNVTVQKFSSNYTNANLIQVFPDPKANPNVTVNIMLDHCYFHQIGAKSNNGSPVLRLQTNGGVAGINTINGFERKAVIQDCKFEDIFGSKNLAVGSTTAIDNANATIRTTGNNMTTLAIYNTHITKNYGCPVRWHGASTDSKLKVYDCLIEDNFTCLDANVRGGGGLLLKGPADVRRCTIRNNRSEGDGGGIFLSTYTDFSQFTADLVPDHSVLVLDPATTIEGNTAYCNGGGVAIDGIRMKNGALNSLPPNGMNGPGGILWYAPDGEPFTLGFQLNGGKIIGNKALGVDKPTTWFPAVEADALGLGGGVLITRNIQTTYYKIECLLDKGEISGNEAPSKGGGVAIYTPKGVDNPAGDDCPNHVKPQDITVTVGTTDGTDPMFIEDNKANNGGGLYVEGYSLTYHSHTSQVYTTLLKGAYIQNGNNASSNGGGVFMKTGTLTMNNCTINENTAGNDGGGIYVEDGIITTAIRTAQEQSEAPGSSSTLPEPYQDVEYIAISGNSQNNFINTDIPVNTDNTIWVRGERGTSESYTLFGYYSSSSRTGVRFLSTGIQYYWRRNNTGTNMYTTKSYESMGLTSQEITYAMNKSRLFIKDANGNQWTTGLTGNPAGGDWGTKWQIFQGQAATNTTMKFYEAKIYSTGATIDATTGEVTGDLRAHLVPCYNTENGMVGVYDKISNTFIAGTGTISYKESGSSSGGGSGTVPVSGCIVTNNTAKNDGGGIYLNTGHIFLTNSKINNNQATDSCGGGVYNHLGNIYVNYWDAADPTQGTNLTVRGETTPSEFNNNTAGRNGGGINTHRGRIYMRGQTTDKEITISGNTTGGVNKGSGGGVFCMGDGSDATAEQIRLFNVNLIGNKAYGKGTTTTTTTITTIDITPNPEDPENPTIDTITTTTTNTVTNGSGGGIYLQYGGINLTKVKMQGNYAQQNGGGLNNHNGVINVRGCTIGGDTYYNNGEALEGNKADSCGGGVYTQLGDITITNHKDASLGDHISKFSHNIAGDNGGGINTHSGQVVATGEYTHDFSKDIFIDHNKAINGSGGGIFCMGDGTGTLADPDLLLTYVSLVGNKAEEGTGELKNGVTTGCGGGMYLQEGAIYVKDTDMEGNYANHNGGAINNHKGDIRILGSMIGGDNYYSNGERGQGNKARNHGGGIYTNLGNVDIQDFTEHLQGTVRFLESKVTYNEAGENGGGINTHSGTITVNYDDETTHKEREADYEIEIAYNKAKKGGGIYANAGTIITANAKIENNMASENGGGVNNHAGDITFYGGTLSNNTAENGKGGGAFTYVGDIKILPFPVDWSGSTTQPTLNDGMMIYNNIAKLNGGGINNHTGRIDMRHARMKNNTSSLGNGGGIFCEGPHSNATGFTIRMLCSEVIQNKTRGQDGTEADPTGRGGGIYLKYGSIYAHASDILLNSANINGGGVNNHEGTMLLYGCNLVGNTAVTGRGGGIYTHTGSITTGPCTDRDDASKSRATLIDGNFAKINGGGINNHEGDIQLNGDHITNNVAEEGHGGGIYINNGEINMFGGKIANNEAKEGDGGGVWSGGGTFNIQKRQGKPIIDIVDVDVTSPTTATVHYHLIDKGKGTSVTEHGIFWDGDKIDIDTVNYETFDSDYAHKINTGHITGEDGCYRLQITGLSANTTYYTKSYALNNASPTALSNTSSTVSFTTFSSMPTVLTGGVSNITMNGAEANGKILNEGSGNITARGIQVWKKSETPAASHMKSYQGTETFFTVVMTDLDPDTEYCMRAYATNAASPSYDESYAFGETVEFKTLKNTPNMTPGPLQITNTVLNDGKYDVSFKYTMNTTGLTAFGFIISTDDDPELHGDGDHTVPGDNGNTVFTGTKEGLEGGTVYYVRAYASNITDPGLDVSNYSLTTPIQFTTPNTNGDPVVKASSISNITRTGATISGEIVHKGSTSIIKYGLCWSNSNHHPDHDHCTDLDWSNPAPGSLDSGSTFNITLPDTLKPNTTYYVRIYATNGRTEEGSSDPVYVYSNDFNFTTLPITPPRVKISVTDISNNDATVECVVDTCGAPLTGSYGIWWKKDGGTYVQKTASDYDSSTGKFTVELDGLTSDTKYWVKAFCSNYTGTANDGSGPYESREVSFNTLYNKPIVDEVIIDNILYDATGATSHTIRVHGNATVGETGQTLKKFGYIYSTRNNPTIYTLAEDYDEEAVEVGPGNMGSGHITNLTNHVKDNRYYYVRAYASVKADPTSDNDYSYGPTRRVLTLAQVNRAGATSTHQSAQLSARINSYDEEHHLKKYGVCWAVQPAIPTIGENNYVEKEITTEATPLDFRLNTSDSVASLTPGDYYWRAYVKNEDNESDPTKGISYTSAGTFHIYNYAVTAEALPANAATFTSTGYYNNPNPKINLTATVSSPDYVFDEWRNESNEYLDNANPHVIDSGSLTSSRHFKAYFESKVTIIAGANGLVKFETGTTTTNDNVMWGYNNPITVCAIPNTGYEFANWTNADGEMVSEDANYTFSVTDAIRLTANFRTEGSGKSVSTANVPAVEPVAAPQQGQTDMGSPRPRDIYPAPAREPWNWDDDDFIVVSDTLTEGDTIADGEDKELQAVRERISRTVTEPVDVPQIIENKATEGKGGGIYMENNDPTNPTKLVFAGGDTDGTKGKILYNYAGQAGGGIYIARKAYMQMKGHCEVNANWVPKGKDGGGIYLAGRLYVGENWDDALTAHALKVRRNFAIDGSKDDVVTLYGKENLTPTEKKMRSNILLARNNYVWGPDNVPGQIAVEDTANVITILSNISGKHISDPSQNVTAETNMGFSVKEGFCPVVATAGEFPNETANSGHYLNHGETANGQSFEDEYEKWLANLMPQGGEMGLTDNSAIFEDSETYIAIHSFFDNQPFRAKFIYLWGSWTNPAVQSDPEYLRPMYGGNGPGDTKWLGHYIIKNSENTKPQGTNDTLTIPSTDTKADTLVWEIYSEEGLAWFSNYVNGLNSFSTGDVFPGSTNDTIHRKYNKNVNPYAKAKLMNDLDMRAHFWVPIGSVTKYNEGGVSSGGDIYTDEAANPHPFKGEFDGQGHVIKGIDCRFLTGIEKFGLFGDLSDGAVVKNVFVDDALYATDKINNDFEYMLGGISGVMSENAILSGAEARATLDLTVCKPDKTYAGGLVGKTRGTNENRALIHSSMAMPEIKGEANFVGGLVGYLHTSDSLINSFSNPKFLNEPAATKYFGGLVGVNKGLVENCYARLQDGSSETRLGFLAGTNNDGNIKYSYIPNGKPYLGNGGETNLTGHTNYGLTQRNSDDGKYNYAHKDQQMDATTNGYAENGIFKGLLPTLNNWVRKQDFDSTNWENTKGYAQWSRTLASDINGDYPVLMLGDFRSLGSADNIFIHYDDSLSHLVKKFNGDDYTADHPQIFVYDADSSWVDNNSNVSIFIDENVGLTQNTGNVLNNVRVGVTLDNSKKGSGDWHFFASPLKDVPLGLEYHTKDADPWYLSMINNSSSYTLPDYGGGSITASEVEGDNNVEPGHQLNAINHATWSDRNYTDPPKTTWSTTKPGFFPTNTPYGTWRPQNGGHTADAVGGYFDFYCYDERTYHWINFKREGSSEIMDHWYENENSHGNHNKLYYMNEDKFLEGKGYLVAVRDTTMLMADGTLNNDRKKASVSYSNDNYITPYWPSYAQMLRAVNLVGNPYQSYLDFTKFAETNSAYLIGGNQASYAVMDQDSTSYIYYTAKASINGIDASPYIHPMQSFFVRVDYAEVSGPVTGQSLTFENDMRIAAKWRPGLEATEGISPYRGLRPNYPLVNLICTDSNGKRDYTTVETGRPDVGGGHKMRGLHAGNAVIYAHYNNNSYQTAFTPAGVSEVPVRFDAIEPDNFTIRWNTMHGDFSYLHLIDNLTGMDIDCLTNSEYRFQGNPTDYKSRFKLVFHCTGIDEEPDDTTNDNGTTNFAFQMDDELVVNGEGTLQLFDINGRCLLSTQAVGEQSTISLPRVAAGIYVLRLTNHNQTKVQKMVIK